MKNYSVAANCEDFTLKEKSKIVRLCEHDKISIRSPDAQDQMERSKSKINLKKRIKMKKLFFPLVAVVGLTAMSFTSVKAETVEVKEVSMEEAKKSQLESDGKLIFTKTFDLDDGFKETIIYASKGMTNSNQKLDNILSKY